MELRLNKKMNIAFRRGVYFVTENGDFGITFSKIGFNIKKGFCENCYYWFK